jgi:hypothetical protein
MKGFVILGLAGVGALALWKRYLGAVQQSAALGAASAIHAQDANLVPAGVPTYDSYPAPQRIQQVYAGWAQNPQSVSTPGYAPPIGDGDWSGLLV